VQTSKQCTQLSPKTDMFSVAIWCSHYDNLNTRTWNNVYSELHYLKGGPKTGPSLKDHNSCTWWLRKAFDISKRSALYR